MEHAGHTETHASNQHVFVFIGHVLETCGPPNTHKLAGELFYVVSFLNSDCFVVFPAVRVAAITWTMGGPEKSTSLYSTIAEHKGFERIATIPLVKTECSKFFFKPSLSN
jgi:hypothetical protein